jgi:transglutaminase-like putative cysteine protease
VDEFLADDAVIDWKHPDVLALARELGGPDGPAAVASRCFLWVRDEVRHSVDHQDQIVTCAASDVLRHRTGFCYAKSHLLAALLRANQIPAGFVYQRLSVGDSGPPFCLHGLNAVFLPETGWYRVDARGDRPGIVTRFTPPTEVLAFKPSAPGETTFEGIFPTPLPIVVAALRRDRTVAEVLANLPDCLSMPCGGEEQVGDGHSDAH